MMKEFVFDKNGIYYRVNNFDPERKTLVFVHGLTGSSSAWRRYEEKFESRYNILTFDLRGHGESKKYFDEENYKVENFSEDLYELIKFLKIKNFVLISHSFGTIVALDFLRRHSEIIYSAIFINPIYNLKSAKFFDVFYNLIKYLSPINKFLPNRPRKGRHIDYLKYINTGDWDPGRMSADVLNTSTRICVYCLNQVSKYKHGDSWKGFNFPVLIVHGDKDTISPVENAVKISRMLKRSKFVILKGANHVTIINNFEEVSREIVKFVG